MQQLISELFQLLISIINGYFETLQRSLPLQLATAAWILLGAANRDGREKLLGNIAYFLREPLAYDKTSPRREEGIYPIRWFEALYQGCRWPADRVGTIVTFLWDTIQGGISKNLNASSILQSIAFLAFIYADAITAFNILQLMDLLMIEVPFIFREYSIAVTFGTILSLLIVGLVGSELFNENSDVWEGKIRVIGQWIAGVLLLSSVATIIGINCIKLLPFVELQSGVEQFIEFMALVFLHVFVPFNAALATVLLHKEGIRGLEVFLLIVIFGGTVLFGFVHIVIMILGNGLPICADIVLRIIFVTLNLVVWVIIAPMELVLDTLKPRKQN